MVPCDFERRRSKLGEVDSNSVWAYTSRDVPVSRPVSQDGHGESRLNTKISNVILSRFLGVSRRRTHL
eukprot:7084744-Prymnesium_polylepis.1